MTTPTLIELVDSALSTQTQYALQPCWYRTGVAKKAKMALLDALEAQAAEIERLTQDRDEWKQSTIDANTNARSEEAKRRAMQDERDTLKAELAALKAQPVVAWIEHDWSGAGARHLCFERRAPSVRDQVVNPIWTPLCVSAQAQAQPTEPAPSMAGDVPKIGCVGHDCAECQARAALPASDMPDCWVVVKDGAIIGTHDEPCHLQGIDAVRYVPAALPAWAPLTVEAYTAIAHRTASKYAHRSDLNHIAYTFLPRTLDDFVRKIEAAHGITQGEEA
jgi:hypothetical protein